MKSFTDYIQTIHPISPEAEKALLGTCRLMSIKKNAILQPIGHTCKTIYFIKKGALRIFYYKGNKDITESLEFEQAFVARAESLISGTPSKKGIQALEDSELIAIDANQLLVLYDRFLDLERLFKNIMLKAFVHTLNRIENLQFHAADVRYGNLVRDHPDILRRVPLKYIASYLGITQVSLSRIRGKYS